VRVNQVGRYTLLAELAQGGMGTVYLGVARGPAGFSKLMVIKQLRPELAEDPQFLNMFLEEARLAARLNHPNVVQTVEVGAEKNAYFIAMEFLDGQALQRVRTRVSRHGDFPLALHVKIIVEALHGLHHAHELRDLDGTPLQIVHRDISPHNVFVTYEGQVKVVDFGIAKAIDSSLETRTGELKGKVAYMPPEQASMKRVDRRADIFAVGVMLWEAIAQRRMWHGMNEMAIMHRLMIGDLPRIRDVRPDVDPELERIVTRAIAPMPQDRQATAEEMASELEAWLARMGPVPTARDIGRLLAQVFAQDREELGRIIEQQLRKIRELPETLPSAPGLPVTYEPIDLSRMQLTPGSIASSPSVQTREPQTGTGATQSAFTGPRSYVTAGAPVETKPFPVGLALAGLGALVLVAGGIFVAAVWSRPAPITAQPPALATSAPAATTSSAPPSPDRITLTLAADPPSAKFFVDGTPVDGNPYAGPYRKDGLTHQIRVEASGYETERFAVVFDADVQKQVAMRKRAAGPVVRPPPTVAPSAMPSADTPVPKKPPREIDTAYPTH
jgi:serine/threonine-protein kinase